MNKAKYAIIAFACICIICGGFYFFAQSQTEDEKQLTEMEKVIAKDLDKSYPKTPREVVKFYNRIVQCYHSQDLKGDDLEKLVDQMMLLWGDDLLAKNTKEEYYAEVQSDIAAYKKANKSIIYIVVCDTNDVKYMTDERNGDKLAFVDATYTVNTNGEVTKSDMRFGLVKDSEGEWKLIGVTLTEGNTSEDD